MRFSAKIIIIMGCLIGGLTMSSKAQNADIRWLRSVNSNRSETKTVCFTSLSNSAYVVPFAYPLWQLSVGKVKNQNIKLQQGYFSAVSLGTASLLSYALKVSIQRPRPYVTYPNLIIDKPAKNYSFPSGHTTVAFCAATSMVLDNPKWYIALPAYTWACSVAWSRMYLGKHYPTDLLGGIIIGVGVPLLFKYCKPVNRFVNKTGKFILKY